MNIRLFISLALVCFLSGEVAAEPRVLILPFDPIIDSTYNIYGEQVPILDYQSALQTMIVSNLGKRTEIRVIERVELEKLISQKSLRPAFWNDPLLASELGTKLGADFVIIGNYGEFPSEIRVDARIAIPATADVPVGYSLSANGSLWDDLPTIADRISALIVEKVIAGGTIRPVSKGILYPEGDLADFDLAGKTPDKMARLVVWTNAPAPSVRVGDSKIEFKRCERIDLMDASAEKVKDQACKVALIPSGKIHIRVDNRGYLPYGDILDLSAGKAYRLEVDLKVVETQLYR
jgi:hypothetical protein